MLGRASAFAAAKFAAAALGAAWFAVSADATDSEAAAKHLRFDWYRVEVAVFRRDGAAALGAARPRLLDAFRLPRLAAPLLEQAPPATGWVLNPRIPPAHTAPVLVSNLPPPIWFGGACAQASWTPPAAASARDPCLWHPPPAADLEAYFPDEPSHGLPIPNLPPEEPADALVAEEPPAEDLRSTLVERLEQAFAQHENQLLDTSYMWKRATPDLAALLPPLRQRFDLLAAGGWHQPVPPRDQPFPLLAQFGPADSSAPSVLEGTFAVTLGRYLHFEARLLLRPAQDGAALLLEKRRMRSGERHYLDHPAFGVIVSIKPVELPDELLALAEDLDALDETLGAYPANGEGPF